MAMTGFDPSVVTTSINAVNNAYKELINQLGNEMQSKFVVGMSDKWACVNAQTFFRDAFKPSVDELIINSNRVFESVISAMNSAGRAWASSTGSSYSQVSFSTIEKKIDISSIKENIGGVRGIDLQSSGSVINQLPVIASAAGSALTSAQQAVQNCGFIGGNQANNLISSLGTIKSRINAAVTDLTNEAKAAMEQTVSTYTDTEGKVSKAFQAE